MELNKVISFIKTDYQWFFSGFGVLLISLLISCLVYFFRKRKMSSSFNKVTQKNIVAGGDVVGRDKN
ncbi:hypothetical protein B0F87_107205 [Methylobacter tundripaludum]|uniref:Uncharacterized protein n=1 Tax=Methylobacter tundripaludum TaxID=173365 RepID=A0A2S6HBZ2_9GAMM|nr:hypothetical protein [Methylobacter tundripaludum]PPK74962.1 hypothetical protein B0F87_107205 [Methylobacter tundripaludum]